MSKFSPVSYVIPPELFVVLEAYIKDPTEKKIDLIGGIYRTEKNEPWVLPVVRKAERAVVDDMTLNKNYLPLLGIPSFCEAAAKLVLGDDSPIIAEKRIVTVQTIAASGALRMGAEFLAKCLNYTVYCNTTTPYDNHELIFRNAGFTQELRYRYWSRATKSVDLEGMLEDLRNAPENAVVILQNCGHCPTGCDPTRDQWRQIADVIVEKNLFPFFDCVYHGLGSGDLEEDAWPIRYFVARNIEMLISQSFSKHFGLYSERVGNLIFVLANADAAANIRSRVTWIARGSYISPPAHGARIVDRILKDATLTAEWRVEVKQLWERLQRARSSLRAALERIHTPGDWSHITAQTGFFYIVDLTVAQCDHMIKKYHVYILHTGRMCIAGITPDNVDYVARAIKQTMEEVPS